MKTYRSLLRVLIYPCIAAIGIANSEAQPPPTRILPLGDSLTSGTSVVGAYRNGLYQLLESAGYQVDFVGTLNDAANPTLPDRDHQGMGGYRIDQLQSGLPWWLKRIEAPDVVLLMIGTNDFSANFDPANAPARLTSLISDLATRLPFAKIIVATLPLRTDSASLEAQQAAFNAAIPGIVANQAALGRHVTHADIHAALQPGDLEEGVHPTAAGYQKIAETWFPAIAGVISPLGGADAPAVAGTGTAADLEHITVHFSKPVADSAANPANFTINGGLGVTQASLDSATKRSVTLTTTPQIAGALYRIAIGGVVDRTPQQNPIAAGATAYHTALTLANGSFENGESGWSMAGNRIVYPTTPPYTASHGGWLLVMNGGQTAPNAYISQDFGTVPGQTYRLEYDAGVLALNTTQQRLGVQITGTTTHLAEVQTLTGNGAANTVWSARSHVFTADSTVTNLAFGDLSTTTNSIDLLLDDVRIVAIPADGNSAPLAVADSYATPFNTALVVAAPGVLGNDNDLDGDPLAAVLASGPSHGTLALQPDGAFTYTPATGYIGPDSFTYRASDGILESGPATVSITVLPDNPSTLVNGSFEDGESGWTMTGNHLVYTSTPPYSASDGSKLLVLNGGQGVPNARVSQAFPTIPGQTYTLRYDVGTVAFNNAEQRLGVQIDGTQQLLAQVVSVFGNSQGNTVWTARDHTFVADSAQTTLTFGDLSTTTSGIDLLLDNVRITTTGGPSNTAPVAADDFYQTTAGVPIVIPAPGVLANDSDAENHPLAAALVSGPAHGSLTLNPDGGFAYTPAAGYVGQDSFSYRASDGQLVSSTATVTLAMLVPNASPVAAGDSYSIQSGGVLSIPAPGVLGNDNDPDGDPLTAVPDSGPAHGSLTLDPDGSFTYTPDAGYTGQDAFTYRASDGSLESPATLVTVSVFDAAADMILNGSFEDDYTGWTPAGNQEIAYLSATDGIRVVAFNSHNLTPDATLRQTFATVPGQTYVVSFDMGVWSYVRRTMTLGVTVEGAGTLLSRNTSLRGAGTGGIEWTSASYSFIADSASSTLVFTDRSASTIGIDVLLDNVKVTGQSTGGNDAPQAVADFYTTRTGTQLVVPANGVLANDFSPQATPLAAVLDGVPANGSISLQPDGGFVYTPNTGFTGADAFSYHAVANGLNSNNVLVTIQVTPADDGLLDNPSFESDFAGWTFTGNTTIEFYQPTHGVKVADFNARNRTPNGTLSQSFPTIPGRAYTLEFDAGVISYTTDSQTLGVTVTGLGTRLSETIVFGHEEGSVIRWRPQAFTFVADSAMSTLLFRDLSTATVGIDLLIDNVRISEWTAPEAAVAATALPQSDPPPPTLEISADGAVLCIDAVCAGKYIVERSEDLEQWELVDEHLSDGCETLEFREPRCVETEPRMFYRYRVAPH